jgi:hypothetical protein
LGEACGCGPVVFPLKDCFCFNLDVFTENLVAAQPLVTSWPRKWTKQGLILLWRTSKREGKNRGGERGFVSVA